MSNRYRNWCFTLFVEEEKDYGSLFNSECDARYAVWQLERSPETSRLHIQGYVEFDSPMRLGRVKRSIGDDSVHLERRMGSANEAIAYCKKEESRVLGPWEYGSHSHSRQGRRTDLHEVSDNILSGKTLYQVVDEHPTQYIKYRRGIESLIYLTSTRGIPKWRSLQVLVYYGDSGTGKTRKAIEDAGDEYYILDQADRLWFDGYHGDKTLIIDDFYGWIKYGMLLRILDGHPYRCEIKGGFTPAAWTRVVITSNKHPNEWYATGITPALRRRIHSVLRFSENDVVEDQHWNE